MPVKHLKLSLILLLTLFVFGWLWTKYPGSSNEPVGSMTSVSRSPISDTESSLPEYLGSDSCAGCHPRQFEDWRGSHHDLSMQHATADTVAGDFNDTVFSAPGMESRFYRRGDDFLVQLPGANGTVSEHRILYTFGTYPLQQYIVALPGGRLQVLPVAWDTRDGGWFFPQQDLHPENSEWIFWTNGGMNWNSMCADCHSTNLKKNYNPQTDSYRTTWSVINVGCEACHGPGSAHVRARSQPSAALETTPMDMLSDSPPNVVVNKCGRCHSRRQALTSVFRHDSDELLDHYMPAVLRSDLYQADGQIREEVFVYGSYLQSRMYGAGVSCRDCHDPHSAKLRADGNKLCTRCHGDSYDSPEHHHHNAIPPVATAETPTGTRCIDCHMPGRYFMARDFRRDHSFRIPRPDLSLRHGTDNACNTCHADKDTAWAARQLTRWYGDTRPAGYSDQLAVSNAPESMPGEIIRQFDDPATPAIVRATLLQNLVPHLAAPEVRQTLIRGLRDREPLVRTLAVRGMSDLSATERTGYLPPLLFDSVRAVRLAAAGALVDISPTQLLAKDARALERVRREYALWLRNNADLPSGRHQIALDHHRRGELAEAEKEYLRTLAMDDHYNLARLNLAQLYYQQGRLEDVAASYRAVLKREPDSISAIYSLGLLMAELGQLEDARVLLEKAARLGSMSRAWYNLAILYQQQKNIEAAEAAYGQALASEALNPDYLNGIISLYLQNNQWDRIDALMARTIKLAPGTPWLAQLAGHLAQLKAQRADNKESLSKD